MPWSPLEWFSRPDGLPGLVSDLRRGRAGWPLRVALSLAAAAIVLAVTLGLFGLIETSGQRVRDEHISMGLCCGFTAWCAVLAWIWAGYRHWRRTIRTAFCVLGVWAVVIGLSIVFASSVNRSELFIASMITAGIGVTIAIIAMAAYQGRAFTPVLDSTGGVNVACPNCDYSLVGLEGTTCPECGSRFTIDQLIKAQGYGEDYGQDCGEQSNDRPPALPALLPHSE